MTCDWSLAVSPEGAKSHDVACHVPSMPPTFPTPPPLENQCPSCRRRFSCEASVLQHMNNPSISCPSWFQWAESLFPSGAGRTSPDSDDLSYDNDAFRNNEAPPDDEPMDGPTPLQYEDLHPNTPLIFGSGPGFVDGFNSDRFAKERKNNVYFPFSSKQEWGLASWLTHSGLSMRAMDDFLALPIVRDKRNLTNPPY